MSKIIHSVSPMPLVFPSSGKWDHILRKTPYGRGGEIQITDALRTSLDSEQIIACEFNGLRFDCGSVDGYFAATKYFYDLQKNSTK